MDLAFSLRRLILANLQVLSLESPPDLSFLEHVLLILIHSLGLFLLSRYFHFSDALTAGLLVGFAQLLGLIYAAFRISPAFLAPFGYVYLILIIRFIYIRIFGQTVTGYFDYLTPNWIQPLLTIEPAAVTAAVLSLLALGLRVFRRKAGSVMLLAGLLTLVALIWAGFTYLGHRTNGVTASDPYAYVQMAVDLADHGTPVHRFHLFPDLMNTGITWYPLVHVGYHLPFDSDGDAITVWPPAGALAYAVPFLLFGESAVYWVNPAFSLLSVLAAGLLAWQLAQGEPPLTRTFVAASAIAIAATANEQVTWAGVTMVDAQAELLTVLAFYLALRARTTPSLIVPLFAGATLVAAYLVRHTQVLFGPSLAILLWWNTRPRGERLRALLLCGGAALVMALPDLWYHQAYLGNWLRPESEELALFSMGAVPETARRLYEQLFSGVEFGWFLPFLVSGIVLFIIRFRIKALALLLWLALSLALHLPYEALRLRDLLPEFPGLAFLAAYGLVTPVVVLLSRGDRKASLTGGLILFAAFDLFAFRVWNTISYAWQPPRPVFGYVTESQRSAFNQLTVLTPPGAVIGSSLNDGAIELYARRDTFRPDVWTADELARFVDFVMKGHPDVYFLYDSNTGDQVLSSLSRYRLERAANLDVPQFGEGAPALRGALFKIEK